MEVTIKDLVQSENVLVKISKMEMPLVVSYKVNKVIRKAAPELTAFMQAKSKLFDTYGTDDGTVRTIKEENYETYLNELSPVLEQVVDIPVDIIPLEEFKNSINITPEELQLLKWLIKMED